MEGDERSLEGRVKKVREIIKKYSGKYVLIMSSKTPGHHYGMLDFTDAGDR